MPVRKVKDGWKVENLPTIFPTREQAVAQLKAIKARQRKKRH